MQKTINKRKDNTNKLIWLVFLLNPFVTFIYVMRKMYSKYFVSIVTAFCGFYGFTYTCLRTGADCFRHREDFIHYHLNSEMSWSDFFGFLYGDRDDSVDVLLPFLKYVLSRITGNPDILYMVLGISFGYFLAKNLKMIYSEIGGIKNQFLYLFLLLFFFTIAPWEINSYRFWMAGQVLFYGFYPYLINNDKKKLVFILLTPLIHFSFLYALAIVLIYFVLGNRTRLYIYLLFASLFISNIEYSTIGNLLPETEISSLDDRKTSYLRDSDRESNANWYVSLRQTPIKWLTILLVFFVYYKEKNALNASRYYNLYSFMVLFLALNLVFFSTIPQFGRFYRNSLLFLYAFMFLFFSEKELYLRKWINKFKPFYIFAAMFWLIVEMRIVFDSLSIDTVLLNPIVVAIDKFNIPVNEFINSLF